jgi:hypothetical protein
MDRRIEERDPTVQAVEILFGHTSIKCLVFDISSLGMRVFRPFPPDMPELVTLRLPDGAYQVARRAWEEDGAMGFEYLTVVPR